MSDKLSSTPTPPATANAVQEPRFLLPSVFVPDYIDLDSVQKCLEDRRSDFVPVNSTTFSAERELEKRPYEQFLVLEKDHFALYSYYHSTVKFSYMSRNAVMSQLWRRVSFSDMSLTSFVKVAGLWQLDRPPTLCFAFGEDADALRSSYLIDDNAIAEYYESTATMDMAELAITAQSKTGLCMSDFFVVNRGKGYWAVDTRDPSISYAFGPSTKTRTITKLANGFATIRELIDEEQRQLQGDEGRASQSSSPKLGDINGEEVVVGERFVLRLVGDLDYDEDEDPEGGKLTMFDGWGWARIFNQTLFGIGREASVVGEMDDGACFGLAIVDGVTYITFEGQFMQIEDRDSLPGLVILSSVPAKRNRVHISYFDGGYIALSRWGAADPVVYEWLKARCGVFTVYNVGDPFHISDSAKLRIVKV